MKTNIPPYVGGIVIAVAVLVVGIVMYSGSKPQSQPMPQKMPSGPMTLPPSQQGRVLPSLPPAAH